MLHVVHQLTLDEIAFVLGVDRAIAASALAEGIDAARKVIEND